MTAAHGQTYMGPPSKVAERPQQLFLVKPAEEIHQPGTPIGLTDGGGCLCGMAHINAFHASDYS